MEQQTSSKVQRQHMLDKELKSIDNTGFDKASARADLSYVSRQQDKFQIFSSAGKRINIKRKQLTKISRSKRNLILGVNKQFNRNRKYVMETKKKWLFMHIEG